MNKTEHKIGKLATYPATTIEYAHSESVLYFFLGSSEPLPDMVTEVKIFLKNIFLIATNLGQEQLFLYVNTANGTNVTLQP